MEEEKIDVFPVPENIDYDLNIGNFSFQFRRVVEGLLIAVVLLAITYFCAMLMRIKPTYMIALLVFSAGFGLAIGVAGINGDSISNYLLSAIKFRNNRRTAFYNPRVKSDLKSFTDDNKEDDYVIPRERLEALYRSLRNRKLSDDTVNNAYDHEFDRENMRFEDDYTFEKTRNRKAGR